METFKWDGSFIDNLNIISVIKIQRTKYWAIKLNNYVVYCEVRASRNLFPVIVDEIKPLFGLKKLGTHWCYQNGIKYILTQANINNNGDIIQNTLLKDFSLTDQTNNTLINEIRKIFVFKDILGVNKNDESHIIIIKNENNCFPISYMESIVTDSNSTISTAILEKWFIDINIDDIVKDMTNIENGDQVLDKIYNIHDNIVSIIEKMDRNLITFADLIRSRLLIRLQSCFKYMKEYQVCPKPSNNILIYF